MGGKGKPGNRNAQRFRKKDRRRRAEQAYRLARKQRDER